MMANSLHNYPVRPIMIGQSYMMYSTVELFGSIIFLYFRVHEDTVLILLLEDDFCHLRLSFPAV
jgi:hypothetical protein